MTWPWLGNCWGTLSSSKVSDEARYRSLFWYGWPKVKMDAANEVSEDQSLSFSCSMRVRYQCSNFSPSKRTF